MEHLQQIVSPLERTQELAEVMRSDRPGTLREYIAQQVEMAYLAGVNKSNLRRSGSELVPQETGEVLTLARAYCKDKGFKI